MPKTKLYEWVEEFCFRLRVSACAAQQARPDQQRERAERSAAERLWRLAGERRADVAAHWSRPASAHSPDQSVPPEAGMSGRRGFGRAARSAASAVPASSARPSGHRIRSPPSRSSVRRARSLGAHERGVDQVLGEEPGLQLAGADHLGDEQVVGAVVADLGDARGGVVRVGQDESRAPRAGGTASPAPPRSRPAARGTRVISATWRGSPTATPPRVCTRSAIASISSSCSPGVLVEQQVQLVEGRPAHQPVVLLVEGVQDLRVGQELVEPLAGVQSGSRATGRPGTGARCRTPGSPRRAGAAMAGCSGWHGRGQARLTWSASRRSFPYGWPKLLCRRAARQMHLRAAVCRSTARTRDRARKNPGSVRHGVIRANVLRVPERQDRDNEADRASAASEAGYPVRALPA